MAKGFERVMMNGPLHDFLRSKARRYARLGLFPYRRLLSLSVF